MLSWIYAFMDSEDDAKIGVKSLALLLQGHHYHYKAWIMGFYVVFIALILFSAILVGKGAYVLLASLVAFMMLAWQVWTLDIKSRENCLKRFQNNSYVGLVLGAGMLNNHSFLIEYLKSIN